MTRKLVDAAQDVIIVEPDCGTGNGIIVRPIYEGDDEVVDLATSIVGRVSCETIANPVTKETIIKANQLIEEGAGQLAHEDRRRAAEDSVCPHM